MFNQCNQKTLLDSSKFKPNEAGTVFKWFWVSCFLLKLYSFARTSRKHVSTLMNPTLPPSGKLCRCILHCLCRGQLESQSSSWRVRIHTNICLTVFYLALQKKNFIKKKDKPWAHNFIPFYYYHIYQLWSKCIDFKSHCSWNMHSKWWWFMQMEVWVTSTSNQF